MLGRSSRHAARGLPPSERDGGGFDWDNVNVLVGNRTRRRRVTSHQWSAIRSDRDTRGDRPGQRLRGPTKEAADQPKGPSSQGEGGPLASLRAPVAPVGTLATLWRAHPAAELAELEPTLVRASTARIPEDHVEPGARPCRHDLPPFGRLLALGATLVA